MIFGIINAILFLISCIIPLIAKKQTYRGKAMMKVHCRISVAATVLAIVHFILTLSLINQRPLGLFIVGGVMVLCMIASSLQYLFGKPGRLTHRIHRILALIILAGLCLHVYIGLSSFSNYKNAVSQIHISDVELSSVPDGVYEGACNVGYIYARVRVTVSNKTITQIDLLEHRNEQGEAGERIVDSIIQEQTVQVDAIASATNSSTVIKKAVENALTGR